MFNSESQKHEPVIRVTLQHVYHASHTDRHLAAFNNNHVAMNSLLQLETNVVEGRIKTVTKKSGVKQYDAMPKMDQEDESGGFVDAPAHPSTNLYDQKDSMRAFKTELLNAKDVSYLGPIFIGSPKSQGAMVVYDTGSDWLTVKACFTDQHCHMAID